MGRKTSTERDFKFETLQLHVTQEEADPGNIYGRLTNPTEGVFEQKMATLEGGVAALAVESGSVAITYSILNIAHAHKIPHLVDPAPSYHASASQEMLAQLLLLPGFALYYYVILALLYHTFMLIHWLAL